MGLHYYWCEPYLPKAEAYLGRGGLFFDVLVLVNGGCAATNGFRTGGGEAV